MPYKQRSYAEKVGKINKNKRVLDADGADGGKTAHYMLRWVKSSGDKGPWSETVSATITA